MIPPKNNTNISTTEHIQFPALPPQEFIAWFGQMLLQGFAPEKQYTVSEWIDHVIATKASSGRKRKTISGYRYCAIRVKDLIGDMRICDVRPNHISDLFAKLKEETVNTEARAILKENVDLKAVIANTSTSIYRLAKTADISESTVDRAVNGLYILYPKAEAIAAALGTEVENLFKQVDIERTLSNSTLESYRRFVSLVFSVAVRELQIPYNPVDRVERISFPRKKVETLQLEDIQTVWAAAEQEPIDKRCMIHMFLITGGRRGEVAGFRWSRISWEASAILFQQYQLLVQRAKENGNRLPRRVEFFCDEFGNFVKIPDMDKAITIGRGYGCRFHLVVQDTGQIYDKYGERLGKSITSNCNTWVYLQTGNDDTIKEIVNSKLGKYTIKNPSVSGSSGGQTSASYGYTGRDLLTVEEIGRIRRPWQLVMINGHNAMMYAPDISKTFFNQLYGMGSKNHNQRLQAHRNNQRPIHQASVSYWDGYKKHVI